MSLPDPLVPPDLIIDADRPFPLDVQRLLKSDFWLGAATTHEMRVIALELWALSWTEMPAGSLPSSDAALARLASFGRDVASWLRVRDAIMAPWVLCSDGRFYHPVVCEVAVASAGTLIKRRASDRIRKQRFRAKRKEIAERELNAPRDLFVPAEAGARIDPGDLAVPPETVDVTPGGTIGGIQVLKDSTVEEDSTEMAYEPIDWFSQGWAAYPKKGRERSSQDLAAARWKKAAKAVGSEQQLVECIRRFAASRKALEDGGQFVQGFHRWLRDGYAKNYLPDSELNDGDNRTTAASRRENESSDYLRSLHEAALAGSPGREQCS